MRRRRRVSAVPGGCGKYQPSPTERESVARYFEGWPQAGVQTALGQGPVEEDRDRRRKRGWRDRRWHRRRRRRQGNLLLRRAPAAWGGRESRAGAFPHIRARDWR